MSKLRFIHAAPTKTGKTQRKSSPKKPRHSKAEWESSVFYYWWAFLRESEPYLATCESGGVGACSALYADFGDVRDEDFWIWWKTHNHLFAEPPSRQVAVVDGSTAHEARPQTVTLEIPLEGKLSYRVSQVRRELEKRMSVRKHMPSISQAKYQVNGRPVVKALAAYLKTWKIRKAHPKLPYAYIYQILRGKEVDIEAAIKPIPRGKKSHRKSGVAVYAPYTQHAYRNKKFADEIIANVANGVFPLFNQKKGSRVRKQTV